VDKRFLTIEEIDEKGKLIGESKIKNCFQAMDKFGREHDMCKIAIEASYSMPVYRHLAKLGFEVHMAHPGALDKIP
jgi:transposase